MDDPKLDIGLIGLAVMGQNLVLNMNDHGYRVGVYNRTTSVMQAFVSGPASGTMVEGFESLEGLVREAQTPSQDHADGQGRRRCRPGDRDAAAAARGG